MHERLHLHLLTSGRSAAHVHSRRCGEGSMQRQKRSITARGCAALLRGVRCCLQSQHMLLLVGERWQSLSHSIAHEVIEMQCESVDLRSELDGQRLQASSKN